MLRLPAMKVQLEGKIALVTGAARGIGQAIADLLCANGARVVYADLDYETAARAAKASEGGLPLRLDVTDEAQAEAGINHIVREFGRLDILVNNAGVNTAAHRVNIDQFPTEEWRRIMKVDLDGLFFVSRAAARRMVAQKSGRIINIASVLGLVPARLQSPFVAAKAGVVNLTRAMALELGGQGVLVNCVAPGSILTEGTRQLFYGPDGQFSDRAQAMLAHIPLGRPGQVQEIAHMVLFLAAPESSYLNGAIIPVDGGWLAGYIREF
jgi:NAD(P)-dependent dehydrogenase (short-subunit alcohol dehydrogenase family)